MHRTQMRIEKYDTSRCTQQDHTLETSVLHKGSIEHSYSGFQIQIYKPQAVLPFSKLNQMFFLDTLIQKIFF